MTMRVIKDLNFEKILKICNKLLKEYFIIVLIIIKEVINKIKIRV